MERNKFYNEQLNRMQEGLDLDKYVIATYACGLDPDVDPIVQAANIAIEQTTGSWTDVPAETPEMREKYGGKVIGCYEVPEYSTSPQIKNETRWFVVRVAYPSVNFANNISSMIGTLMGNVAFIPNLKLVDIEFGREFVKDFKGPKFGTEGLRDYLGVYDRPLLNNMIKPCTGYTPEVGAELFYEAAAGGVDIIKDDELISGNVEFNKIKDRVKLYMEALEKANKEKNEKTLYVCNITDENSKLKENAMEVIKNGGNGIMINAIATGFSALRDLAEDPDINVPILAHCTFSGAIAASAHQGVSLSVLAKIIRLCGADMFVAPSPYGKFDVTRLNYFRYTQALTSRFYDFKPCAPLYGGGVLPQLVDITLHDAGIDNIIGVGAGIHGHPMGPRAGAKAMRQAIDASINDIKLQDAAKEHEELASAIKMWGLFEDNVKNNFFI